MVQLSLAGSQGINRNAAAHAHGESDIVAVEFDPRRELMYWIDSAQKKIFRSATAKGNQSHEGQPLDIDFHELNLIPTSLGVDFLTGNVYFTAMSSDTNSILTERRKRMSEPRIPDTGSIWVTSSDGRYMKKIIGGHLHVPTSIVTIPQLGRICFADAGFIAKIECADMDGNHREIIVSQLVFTPTSLAVDTGKNNRIFWADPKFKKIESVLPNGSKRHVVVSSQHTPWALDVFENHVYWVSKETQTLYVQDKFGRGRSHILASALPDVHSVRVQQRYAKDVRRLKSSCETARCSHLCVELTNNAFRCLCPQNVTELADGTCAGLKLEALVAPKQCKCENGGRCLIDGNCNCGEFEGEFCQKGSTVSKQLIGRLGSGGIFAMLLMLVMLIFLGVVTVLAMTMYKKRSLFNKKNELADGTVSFRGNVISFGNPVLENKVRVTHNC